LGFGLGLSFIFRIAVNVASGHTSFASIFLNLMQVVQDIISPLPSTLSRYFNLTKSKGVKRGNIFDYYLAATALDNGVDFILTNNADDFSEIEGFTATTLEEVRKIIGEHE